MLSFKKTTFLLSAPELNFLPPDSGQEIAFVGRSNAGKSSTLNAIVGQKNLARTGKTPGVTQTINVFTVENQKRLVDLPGYGFAKAPPSIRDQWQQLVWDYLTMRRALVGLILLMDSRHPFTDLDQEIINFCLANTLPLHILLTKADKLTHSEQQKTIRNVEQQLPSESAITFQLFSAHSGLGREILCKKLQCWFKNN